MERLQRPQRIAILDFMDPSTQSDALRPPQPDRYSQSLGPELAALVASLGSRVRAMQSIGRLVSPASARAAFWVSLSDGREFKARRVESVQRCEMLVRIWPFIEALPFSHGLAHKGASLLEQWIPGHELTPDRVTPERLVEAGEILGRLHRLALPKNLASPHTQLPTHFLSKVERCLGTLASMGLLTGPEMAGLLDEARKQVPQCLDTGLIHHDFCAENLVVTHRGTLWAIDNEDMRVGALDADLARCFLRWSMTTRDRDAFLVGYCRHRRADRYQAHALFWSIWAIAGAAEFRARRALPVNALLTQLRQ